MGIHVDELGLVECTNVGKCATVAPVTVHPLLFWTLEWVARMLSVHSLTVINIVGSLCLSVVTCVPHCAMDPHHVTWKPLALLK